MADMKTWYPWGQKKKERNERSKEKEERKRGGKGKRKEGNGRETRRDGLVGVCGEPDASLQHWVRVRTHCPELTLGLECTRQIPFIVNESWPLGLSFPKASN